MSENEMSHETSGQRLKRLAEENEDKQQTLADFVGVTRTQMSRYYNDRTPLPDETAQKLADRFGVRKEYILCEDDFETEDDLCMYMDPVGDMRAALAYLETLGIHLEPYNELRLPLLSILSNMDAAQKYLDNAELEKLLHEDDFMRPSTDVRKMCTLKMSAPLPDDILLNEKSFSGESHSGSHYVFADDPYNPFHVDCMMISYFKAYRDGEFVQNVAASRVQIFVKELNLYTRFSADHVLLNGDEGDLW